MEKEKLTDVPLHQIQILLPLLLHLSCCCLRMLCLMIHHILLP